MILPGIAPLVREGDSLRNEFTVRNTTDQPDGRDRHGRGRRASARRSSAARRPSRPGQAQAPAGTSSCPGTVPRLAGSSSSRDAAARATRIAVRQTVDPGGPRAYVPGHASASGERSASPAGRQAPRCATGTRRRARHARPARPSVSTALREWMNDYPYACLEQRVSRAVALGTNAAGTQPPPRCPLTSTRRACSSTSRRIARQRNADRLRAVDQRTRPAGRCRRRCSARLRRGSHRVRRGARSRARSRLPTADLSIRKIAGPRSAVAPGHSRAARCSSASPSSRVCGRPPRCSTGGACSGACPTIPERAARLDEAEQIVRARLNLPGHHDGLFNRAEGRPLVADGLGRYQRRAPRPAPARATALWQDDLPRLVRGALARQHRGSWGCTLSNAWGALALEGFSRAFEAPPVSGETAATLGDGVAAARLGASAERAPRSSSRGRRRRATSSRNTR